MFNLSLCKLSVLLMPELQKLQPTADVKRARGASAVEGTRGQSASAHVMGERTESKRCRWRDRRVLTIDIR
jgi:hypothetical protein